MKELPNFHGDFKEFDEEEARREASIGMKSSDITRFEFKLENILTFSYNLELEKFLRSNPLLLAAIVGSISKEKVYSYDEISRKGFGGPYKHMDIDLLPCIVQTMSRIIKNRHPRSIATIPCLNSLYLWTNRASGHIFHYFNSLGDTYR